MWAESRAGCGSYPRTEPVRDSAQRVVWVQIAIPDTRRPGVRWGLTRLVPNMPTDRTASQVKRVEHHHSPSSS